MNKKYLSAVTIMALLLSMMVIKPVTASTQLFFEDFEVFAEGSYPTSFTQQYNGTGSANQKVILTEAFDGSTGQVFQLEGQTNWASEQYVRLPETLPFNLVVDAYIQPVTSSRNAELALRDLNSGSWGTRISSVWFEGNGTIVAVRNGNDNDRIEIGTYNVGQWYRVTLDNDLDNRTYDVYIDGELAASDLPMHPTLAPKEMSLIAHNIQTSRAYFDEVGIYAELPDLSDGTPSASNVNIAGSPAIGESLTGEYDFTGSSESGTTFQWLADTGSQSEVFNTMNIAGVFNNPEVPAEFVLSETTIISSIYNYHWNNGYGAAPGTIALREAGGTSYGPWEATGLYGNLNWEVNPYVELPAGTYTIIDSSNETWANNSESGYRGMTNVSAANYSDDFTPIVDATEQSYLISSDDVGRMIKFEVTVRDSDGLTGIPVTSSSVGPVTMAAVPDLVPGTLQFEASYYGTYEGYDGWIRVERLGGSDGIVSVSYGTADDTAIAGIHYTSASGTLTWNDGDSDVKVIPCIIANDSQYNGYLYYTYTLSNPTGGANLGSQNPLTVQLSDNDNPPTPTGLKASAGNGEVTLEWDEVNSAYYKLYYSTTPDSFTEDNSVGIYEGTSYKMSGLTNGTTYYFAVKAGHNIYYSVLTDAISATPKSPSSGGGSHTLPTIRVITEEHNGSITNSTEIPASTVDGNASAAVTTAIVKALLDKIDSEGGSEKNDLIELAIDTKTGIDELKLRILQKDLEQLIDATDARLSLTSPFISIIFDAKALETISAADSGGTIVISAGIIDNNSLSDEDKAKVQDGPVYDLTVMNGDTQVSNFNGGHATVTIPYTLGPDENPNAVVVYYLAEDGTLKTIRGHYDAALKSVVFKTSHFSNFVIGYNPVTFTDVKDAAWYKNAVDFIAARGITSGTGNNIFNPDTKLIRAQFVVLLMNAYQINTQNQGDASQIQNFSDAGNTYYTDYLMAAKALGIVNGVGNNQFAPEKEITRQEMFVMLYNALQVIDEVPVATSTQGLSNFDDGDQVADWANQALSNLVKAEIVSGSNNELNPTSSTTRAEIAQVLFNLLSK